MSSLLNEYMLRVQGLCKEVEGHWIWIGATVTRGGVSPVMNWKKKTVMVRRQMLLLSKGEPPKGFVAAAICDVDKCVHPDCVKWVSRGRIRRREAKKKTYSHEVRKKLGRGKPKLTLEQVQEIRSSNDTTRACAARMGVSQYAVWAIRAGKTWKSALADQLLIRK